MRELEPGHAWSREQWNLVFLFAAIPSGPRLHILPIHQPSWTVVLLQGAAIERAWDILPTLLQVALLYGAPVVVLVASSLEGPRPKMIWGYRLTNSRPHVAPCPTADVTPAHVGRQPGVLAWFGLTWRASLSVSFLRGVIHTAASRLDLMWVTGPLNTAATDRQGFLDYLSGCIP